MHRSVLVVEDDHDIRESICEALTILGYSVQMAANGKEALDLLERISPPCMILLDLMMPVMDGWQFREVQSVHPRMKEIPVVVVSADNHVAEKGRRLGAANHMKKPVDFRSLQSMVETYCKA